MDEIDTFNCGHCGKEIKDDSFVEISMNGIRPKRFCNPKCWDKFLKERIREARNPERYLKDLKEKQRKYRREKIKKVRAMKKITTNEEIVYFYEGLSNKKKGALAKRLFHGYVRHANGNVKKILSLIDTGKMS